MVGLHIRLTHSLSEVLEKAQRLQLPTFQTFFITTHGKRIKCTENETPLLKKKLQTCNNIVVHASYWVNLASSAHFGLRTLRQELLIAQKLELSTLILHPGSATGFTNKNEGISLLAQRLNIITAEFPDISFILENTAHANLTIGSDVTDFHELFSKLNDPSRFSLCIDTAHAYGYGYDVATAIGQDNFLQLIDRLVGIDKIKLIHLNDTPEALGNKIDKHEIPGQGIIGEQALRRFATLDAIKSKPIILELPVLSEEKEKAILEEVRSWIE